MVACEIQIERRQHEQCESGADGHARRDHRAHREARRRTGTAGHQQRDHREYQRRSGHQHRTKTNCGGFFDRFALRQTFLDLQFVGELHDQDAVFGDHAHQRHQADLGVDVDAHAGEGFDALEAENAGDDRQHIHDQQCAADRHRHGDQHDQRIAEALELRRQHQEDDDQREQQGDQHGRAFLLELPGLARVIHAVALRQHFLRGLLQHRQRLALGHAGTRRESDRHRVQLLETLQHLRLRRFFQGDDGRERNQFAATGAGVVVGELIGVDAVAALHLRNHPVRAVLHRESVGVAARQHRRHVRRKRTHVDAERSGLVAVDLHFDPRFVDLQILVEEDEAFAGIGLFEHGIGEFLQLLQRTDAADHEFAAAVAAGAGQCRRNQREHVQAGDFADLRLQILFQHLFGRTRTLAPGLQHETRDRAVARAATAEATVEQEVVLDLGHTLGDLGDFLGVAFDIVQRRRRIRTADREDEALILGRRRFLRRLHVEEDARSEDDGAKYADHTLGIERAVQPALIAMTETIETHIQPGFEPALAAFVVRLEHLRAHHRRERQCDHAGQQHRARQRECEFGEQHAGETALETDRKIDSDECGGHRHHRPGQLARTAQCGISWRHAFLDMTMDVFQHDDRVVDHDADRQHHRQQRQQIDGEAHHQHQEQSADQRQRHRDRGNQHAAE